MVVNNVLFERWTHGDKASFLGHFFCEKVPVQNVRVVYRSPWARFDVNAIARSAWRRSKLSLWLNFLRSRWLVTLHACIVGIVRYRKVSRCIHWLIISCTFDLSAPHNLASDTSRSSSRAQVMMNGSTFTHTSHISPDFKTNKQNIRFEGHGVEFQNKEDSKSRFCN